MLIRYGTAENGKQQRIAEIYTKEEHRINNSDIDSDAIRVLRKLKSKGFQAYIVGGAVRDLLLGNRPKDFDIATDAFPRKIRKLFWNSRVIGKRFRLVHIHHGEKIIEVSTFRASRSEGNNVYGNIAEDAHRRDFGINSLYYCPFKEQLLDYTEGLQDFKKKIVRPLMNSENSFREDPVRMIRAVKYSCITGFKLVPEIQSALRKQADLLASCSSSRLTEEVFKILKTGISRAIFLSLWNHGLLPHMLPEFAGKNNGWKQRFYSALEKLDRTVQEKKETVNARLIAGLVGGIIAVPKDRPRDHGEIQEELFSEIKRIIRPITPPNRDVHGACRLLLKRKF